MDSRQFSILIIRHSFKGPNGNLNKKGITKARAVSIANSVGSKFKIFTSDIQRSIDTGRIIGEKLAITKTTTNSVLSELPFSDEHLDELGLSGGKWLLQSKITRLLAKKIARFTLDQIENPDRKSQIIAISHVPPIMAFLGHVLAYRKGKKSIDQEVQTELFESFGGKFDKPAFVKPLEGFELTFDNNNKDSFSINFAGHILRLPISFLDELNK